MEKKEEIKTIGFIGGGRITRIFLSALKDMFSDFEKIVVSDPGPDKLSELKKNFPEITVSTDNLQAALCDVIFLAVHAKNLEQILSEIKNLVKHRCILVSLATSFPISGIREIIENKCCVVRMIPNAPSVIRKGYNLIAFSGCEQKNALHQSFLRLVKNFGTLEEVDENKLEAYALITGMGPTYFWFQFHELLDIAIEMGLTEKEAKRAIAEMVKGSVETLLETDMQYEEVADLVPFHPLVHHSDKIKSFYREVIGKLYAKMTRR